MPRALSVGIAVATLAACVPEEPVTPVAPFLVVHAVLDAGGTAHAVNVRWERESLYYDDNFVEDAAVTITGPDGTVYAAVRDSQSYRPDFPPQQVQGGYRVETGPLMPGGTYHLRVEVPGGMVVTGQATVPSAIAFASADTAVMGFSRQTDTLRLSWPRADGAARHLIDIRGRVEHDFGFGFVEYAAYADTSVALPGTMTIPLEDRPVFPAASTVVMSVSAVDENFYEYYRPRTDPFVGAPPTRLTGGQGVFGAIVPIIVQRIDVHADAEASAGSGTALRGAGAATRSQ